MDIETGEPILLITDVGSTISQRAAPKRVSLQFNNRAILMVTLSWLLKGDSLDVSLLCRQVQVIVRNSWACHMQSWSVNCGETDFSQLAKLEGN